MITGAQRGAGQTYENLTMSKELLRLRATRAGNKGVVTKLITEVEQIAQLDMKPKDRLERISLMLDQKWNLLNEYNDKILGL